MHAIDELAEFLLGVSVIEAQHGDDMLNGFEGLERLTTDALGRRIRRDKVGKVFLQGEELMIESVVSLVANGGLGKNVVLVVILANLFNQLRVTIFGLIERHAERSKLDA